MFEQKVMEGYFKAVYLMYTAFTDVEIFMHLSGFQFKVNITIFYLILYDKLTQVGSS